MDDGWFLKPLTQYCTVCAPANQCVAPSLLSSPVPSAWYVPHRNRQRALLRLADMGYGFAVHPESGPAEASTSGSFPHPRFDSFSDAAGADPTGSGWTPSRYDAIVSSLLLLSVGAVTISTCPAPSGCLTVLPPMQPTVPLRSAHRPRQRLSTH